MSSPVRERDRFLVFGAPAIENDEIEEVVACLKSGWVGTGPRVQRFEDDFRTYQGTGYPVAGGPDIRQVLDLLQAIWDRQPVVALDLVEVAPALDPTQITAANAAHILLQVIGRAAMA